MASSNRHWPSMFKSKPHQWQHHEVNSSLVSTGCHRSSSFSPEERTPEPKPRWNPRPEQIRILEAIFDSGMVNPPREEIRKIRAQLQEYGQVGDANVFYWFQNRKSRSKHKLRNNNNSSSSKQHLQQRQQQPPAAPNNPSSSSSSSSSSPGSGSSSGGKSCNNVFSLLGPSTLNDMLPVTFSLSPPPYNFPVTQGEPFLFQGNGFLLPDPHGPTAGGTVQYQLEQSLFHETTMNHGHGGGAGGASKKVKTTNNNNNTATYGVGNPNSVSSANHVSPPSTTISVPFLSSMISSHQLHGADEAATVRTTVTFINDVAFELAAEEPFNVRATFGDNAVIVNASGQAVLTDEWGVTLHPLHPGGFYYLICVYAQLDHLN